MHCGHREGDVIRKGFFDLQTPEHLLAKAHRDYLRMCKNYLDTDAAFDFFVTARHVPDWLEADGRGAAASAFARHVQLRICRHIADGAKHFEATAKQHQQIEGTSVAFFADDESGLIEVKFGPDELVIGLSQNDPETGIYGKRIEIGRLAEETLRVLEQLVQEHPPTGKP